MFNLAWFGSIW